VAEDPLDAFSGRQVANLATIGPDGIPHLVPVWTLVEDGVIHVPTSSATVKARNARARSQVAIMAHGQRSPMGLYGTMVRGRARVRSGLEAVERNRRIHRLYLDDDDLVARPGIAAYLASDDVTIAIAVEQVTTWDLTEDTAGR
jgi:nitroimidazol reductase NimA-like FMN-containing flavoprotein (pyridoxamine 5'-phosphate oxidase superfamily)